MSENQENIEKEAGISAEEALASMTDYERGVAGIAIVCHEANRAVCGICGDHSQTSWEDAPYWQRISAINGVEAHLRSPEGLNPVASHNAWYREKEANGWVYGPIKNEIAKTHPCMVPYENLPPDQQMKDWVFGAIVRAMRNFLPPEDKIIEELP